MAIRTSEARVRSILQSKLSADDILIFIGDASLWVTEELGSAGLSPDRLEVIERYLACAMVRVRELGLSTGTFADISESYQVDPQVTDYLKRAAGFDPTGKIQSVFMPVAERRNMIFATGTTFQEEYETSRVTNNQIVQ